MRSPDSGNSWTDRTKRNYSRLAGLYDLIKAPMERLAQSGHRERLLSRLGAAREILEIGVGTGANLPLYPAGVRVTAIDLSPKMIERARRRTSAADVSLLEMDAEHLDFPDKSFDAVVATCVFCSAPDPVAGMREALRVCRPGGRLLLVEHVRPRNPVLARFFDVINPAVRRYLGPEITRPTVENVASAGWSIATVESLQPEFFKLIVAGRPG